MLQLYGSVNSRAIRVLWMLRELELPCQHFEFQPRSPQTRTSEYLALNPNGRVPTINDDGFVLTESMAINIYLARKFRSVLFPNDPQSQAVTLQWSLWATDRLDRQVVTYYAHTRRLPCSDRRPEIAQAAWSELAPAFDVLEACLRKTSYLLGQEFSVADLNVASTLYRALSLDLAGWPRIRTWLEACWERPAAKHARSLRDLAEQSRRSTVKSRVV